MYCLHVLRKRCAVLFTLHVFCVLFVDARMSCQPCPKLCLCEITRQQKCAINCSSVGLTEFPSTSSLPGKVAAIDLSNNNLTTLPKGIIDDLNHLKTLDLSGNPWVCNCELKWLHKLLHGGTVTVINGVDGMICFGPSSVQGKQLLNLSDAALKCELKQSESRFRRGLCFKWLNSKYYGCEAGDFIACHQTGMSYSTILFSIFDNSKQFNETTCAALCSGSQQHFGYLINIDECLCGSSKHLHTCSCDGSTSGSHLCNKKLLSGVFSVLPLFTFDTTGPFSTDKLANISIATRSTGANKYDWNIDHNSVANTDQPFLLYRFTSAGLYHVTVNISTVDSWSSINSDVMVVESVNGVSLKCPKFAIGGDDLDIELEVKRGTNVSIRWTRMMDAGNTISESTTTSVKSSTVGIPAQPQSSLAFKTIPPIRSSPTPGVKNVLLFPGLWFQHSGIVKWWEFVSAQNISAATGQIRLQVFRPSCESTKVLSLPGCKKAPSPFPECLTTSSACSSAALPECGSTSQYCPLSNQCQSIFSPCSCHSANESCGPSHGQWNSSSSRPSLTMISETVAAHQTTDGDKNIFRLLVSDEMEVKAGDFIGIQYDENTNLVECDYNSLTEWRQTAFSGKASNWFGIGDVINTLTYEWTENVVCYVYASYSNSIHIKPSQALVRTTNSTSISYQVVASNNLSSISALCNVTISQLIKDLMVLHPRVSKPLTSNSNGSIVFEVGLNVTVVISISAGLPAQVTWNLGLLEVTKFGPTCPLVLENLQDCGNLTKFYTSRNFLFRHVVHSARLEMNISSSNHFKILILDYTAQQRITNLSIMPTTMKTLFTGSTGQFLASSFGSIIKYNWTLQPGDVSESGDATFRYTFQNSGQYNLSVKAYNEINTLETRLEFAVLESADISNLNLTTVSSAVLPNEEAIFSLSFNAPNATVLEIVLDYGDSTTINFDLTTSDVVTYVNLTHIYTSVGEMCSNASVGFKDKTKREFTDKVCISVLGKLESVTISTESPVALTDKFIDFTVTVNWLGMSNVTYLWNFDDGSSVPVSVENKTFHRFKTTGIYNVSVVASNSVNEVRAFILITVQEPVQGLQLSYNGPNILGDTTIVSPHITAGSDVLYAFYRGSNVVQDLGPSITFSNIYAHVGQYNISVLAKNNVSSAVAWITVHVIDDDTLEVTHIVPSHCVAVNSTVNVTARVVAVNLTRLRYAWSIDGAEVMGDSQTAQHIFNRSGIWPVSVNVSNGVNTSTFTTYLCVQDPIEGLMFVNGRSFLPLPHGKDNVTQMFSLMLSSGNNYTARWYINNILYFASRSLRYNVVFQSVGRYSIKANVSNEISSRDVSTSVSVQEPVEELRISHNAPENVVVIRYMYTFVAQVRHGTNVRFSWNFGDTLHNETGETHAHAYTSPGTFIVFVTAFNDVNREEYSVTIFAQATIEDLTVAASPSVVAQHVTVVFTAAVSAGSDILYSWKFCDTCKRVVTTISNISRKFTDAGTYTVSVEAQNRISFKNSSVVVLVISPIEGLTIVSALHNGSFAAVHKSIQFLPNITNGGGGVRYKWEIYSNHRKVFQTSTEVLNYIFSNEGHYAVVLIAENSLQKVNFTKEIVALSPLDGLRIETNSSVLRTGVEGVFNLFAEFGTITKSQWTVFKNAKAIGSSNGSLFCYTFSVRGVYRVVVNASDVFTSLRTEITVLVQDPVFNVIIQMVSSTFPFATKGNPELFVATTSRKAVVLYDWLIDDHHYSTETVRHVFSSVGIHYVSLMIFNNVSSARTNLTVFVQEKVSNVKITPSAVKVKPLEGVTFVVTMAGGSNVSYSWDFGDGTIVKETSATVHHVYSISGKYIVGVNATNAISFGTHSVIIAVGDSIEDLEILNCCDNALPSKTQLDFYAAVKTGHVIQYTWTVTSALGALLMTKNSQNITCNFLSDGQYRVVVKACSVTMCLNVTKNVVIEHAIHTISVLSSTGTKHAYSYKNLTFEASVIRGTNVIYRWNIDHLNTLMGKTLTWTFVKEGEHVLKVTASNNVSEISKTVLIQVLPAVCIEPSVTIDGGFYRQFRKSNLIQIEATIDTGLCNSLQVQYQWRIYKTSNCNHLSSEVSLPTTIRTNYPSVLVSPRLLSIGQYCFTLTVYYRKTSITSVERVAVDIIASDIVAIIGGGSERTSPVDHPLVVDASSTYDPDDANSVLLFTWSCLQLFDNNTSVYIPHVDCNRTSARATLEFSGNSLLPNSAYQFVVMVTRPGKNNATASQTVIILPRKVPKVRVECFSCSVSRSYKISPSSHIALVSYCDNYPKSQITYQWTATRNDSKPVILDLTTTKTGASKQNLVIKKGALHDGYDHIFKVTISVKGKPLSSYASILLVANPRPFGGQCSVHPPRVVALTTKVNISCSGWQDDDAVYAPLKYHMSAISGQQDEYLLYYGTQASKEVYLSSFPGGGSGVKIIVHVEDPLGAITRAISRIITVEEPVPPTNQTKTEFLVERSQKDLQYLVKKNDPNSLLQYSIALLLQLNNQSQEAKSDRTGDTQTSKRTLVRETVTEAISNVAVISPQEVQQMAFLLDKLTDFATELQNYTGQALITETIQNITNVLLAYTTQGQDSSEALPNDLLSAIINLVEAVNSQVYDSQMAGTKDKTGVAPLSGIKQAERLSIIDVILRETENLLTVALMSQILNEEPISLEIAGFTVKGQRTIVSEIWQKEIQDGCQFVISETAVKEQPEFEILQIMYVLNKNPYTWGFHEEREVTSRVAALSFRFGNGTKIIVDKLPDNKRIKIVMSSRHFPSQVNLLSANDNRLVSLPNYDPTAGLEYVTINVPPRKMVKGLLNTTTSPTHAAMHVQVRFSGHNGGISVFFGKNFEPTAAKHDSKLELVPEMFEIGQDHQKYTFFVPQPSFDTSAQYFLTVNNQDTTEDVSVSVGVYFSTCLFYNELTTRWDTAGCEPDVESVAMTTVCSCNHLTSFGASVLAPPSAIDFRDLEDLELSENPVIVVTVCSIAALYIVMAIVARRWDLKDLKAITVVPLCGKGGAYKYEVSIVTGRQLGAGTSAHVGIRIYGTNTKSQAVHLSKSSAFQRNGEDVFMMASEEKIEDIHHIKVWHDNTGLNPDWFLSRVTIVDLQSEVKWYFKADDWLSLSTKDGAIEKNLEPSAPEAFNTFSNIFKMESSIGFANRHIWLSVYERSRYSRFTRVQRVNCCATLMYAFMCVNIAWYGLLKTEARSGLWFSWEEVIVGILSSLCVVPIGVILVVLFKRSEYQLQPFDYSGKSASAQTVEMEDMMSRPTLFGYHSQSGDRTQLEDTQVSRKFLKRSNPLHGTIMSREITNMSGVSSDSKQSKLSGKSRKVWWTNDNILSWPEKLPSWKESTLSSIRSRFSGSRQSTIEEQSEEAAKRPRHVRQRFSLPTDLSDDSLLARRKSNVTNENKSRLEEKRPSVASAIHQTLWSDISTPSDCGVDKHDEPTTADRQIAANHQATRESAFSATLLTLGKKRVRQNTIDSCYSGLSSGTFVSASSELGYDWRLKPLDETKTGCASQLPYWFIYVAHTLCLLMSAFCIVVTVLYGHVLKKDVALRWLAAFGVAFLQSVLVIEPFKVLLIATYVAMTTKDKYAPDTADDPVSFIPVIESNEKIKDVKFKPVAGYSLMQARQEASKIKRMRHLIRQAIVYVVFFWFVVAICFLSHDDFAYQQNQVILNQLAWQRNEVPVQYINSSPNSQFWKWFTDKLIPFFGEDIQSSRSLLQLGPVRIIQVRNKNGTCRYSNTWTVIATQPSCFEGGNFDEDVDSYSTGWRPCCHGNQTWVHTSSGEIGRPSVYGKTHTYSGGGYVQDLGPTVIEMEHQSEYLIESNWINERTRMINTEFTLYNANLALFTVVSLTVEFPLSGGVAVQFDVRSSTLDLFVENQVSVLMVCEAVVLAIAVYLLIHCGVSLYHQRASYFLSLWNILELCLVVIAMATVALYAYNLVTNLQTLDRYKTDPVQFVSFDANVHYQLVFVHLNAVIIFILLLQVARQLRFIKLFSVFGKILHASVGKLMGCLLILTLVILAYTFFGYLLFGAMFEEFHSFSSSLLTVVHTLQGHVAYDKFLKASAIWSQIYFTSCTASLYGLGCCLIFAVLSDTYKVTKMQQLYHNSVHMQDYELVDFMIKRFKLWAGIDQQKPAFRKVKFQGLPSASSVSSRSVTGSSGQSLTTEDLDINRGDSSLSQTSLMDRLLPTWEQLLDKFEEVTMLDTQINHLQSRVQQEVEINKRNRSKYELFQVLFCSGGTSSPDGLTIPRGKQCLTRAAESTQPGSRQSSSVSKQPSSLSSRQGSMVSSRSHRVYPTYMRSGSDTHMRKMQRSASDCQTTLHNKRKGERPSKRLSLIPTSLKSNFHHEMEVALRSSSNNNNNDDNMINNNNNSKGVRAGAFLPKTAW